MKPKNTRSERKLPNKVILKTLFLVNLTQGSRNPESDQKKARAKNQLKKNEIFKLKFLNIKVTGYNTNLT